MIIKNIILIILIILINLILKKIISKSINLSNQRNYAYLIKLKNNQSNFENILNHISEKYGFIKRKNVFE